MPLIKDENQVKRESQFLEYIVGDEGNILILKSHLYKIPFHFLKDVRRSVLCKGQECLYCKANYNKSDEYNYYANLNGQDGFINVKPSVFFNIQGISKAQRKDPRKISWTVIKKGSGLDTDYTTSKLDNLSDEEYADIQTNLDQNTSKLVELMRNHELKLEENYERYIPDIKPQQPKKKTQAATEQANALKAQAPAQTRVNEPEGDFNQRVDPSQDVDPEDIPF